MAERVPCHWLTLVKPVPPRTAGIRFGPDIPKLRCSRVGGEAQAISSERWSRLRHRRRRLLLSPFTAANSQRANLKKGAHLKRSDFKRRTDARTHRHRALAVPSLPASAMHHGGDCGGLRSNAA